MPAKAFHALNLFPTRLAPLASVVNLLVTTLELVPCACTAPARSKARKCVDGEPAMVGLADHLVGRLTLQCWGGGSRIRFLSFSDPQPTAWKVIDDMTFPCLLTLCQDE